MKSLKKIVSVGLATGLAAFIYGCSPNYEQADLSDVINYPSQYTNRYIEVQGETYDVNHGFLALGDYYVSSGINTDCSIDTNKKAKAEKIASIIRKTGDYHRVDRIVLKGKFSDRKVLEVREGFVEVDGKRHNF